MSKEYEVIVIGAGVIGPAIATAMARQGRSVLIVERNWGKQDRIVGELMQPAGVKALVELGMASAINDIEAVPCKGYWIKYNGDSIQIPYLEKLEANKANPVVSVRDCVFNDNDKIKTDSTLNAQEWYNDERVQGVSFHNGDFLMNLRDIVKREKNITCIEGTATTLIKDDDDIDVICGVNVKQNVDGQDVISEYKAQLVIACDGIYSKFRKEITGYKPPHIGSYFVGVDLEDCEFPAPFHGHVILGKEAAPVLAYQTSKNTARMLVAYRSVKPPSQSNNELQNYLRDVVQPEIPEQILPSFERALKVGKFRSMPNQYLPALKQGTKEKGFILLGDSLNMRHPLTGGGMTVGLNDAVVLARLLHPSNVFDLRDHKALKVRLAQFHSQRKKLDAVINTLSVALYALFAADSTYLRILQRGCFRYFQLGGACVTGPIGLLSGMLPFPMLLFNHFFSVAFYAMYWNILDNGLWLLPVSLFQNFMTLLVAIQVFVPYLWNELVR